jgi:hypothetical protein
VLKESSGRKSYVKGKKLVGMWTLMISQWMCSWMG